jgi:hypothetical protein
VPLDARLTVFLFLLAIGFLLRISYPRSAPC